MAFFSDSGMPIFKRKNGDGLFRSVMMAYMVLVLHVLLIAGLGLLVIFFRGIVHYMLWIFLFGTAALLGSGYWFYRRMKAEGQTLREMLNTPLFRNKTVEVSLLGGMAAFRIGHSDDKSRLGPGTSESPRQLDWSGASQVQDLAELARLLESGLITSEEFHKAKQKLFKA
jgi:hypothetical protein